MYVITIHPRLLSKNKMITKHSAETAALKEISKSL